MGPNPNRNLDRFGRFSTVHGCDQTDTDTPRYIGSNRPHMHPCSYALCDIQLIHPVYQHQQQQPAAAAGRLQKFQQLCQHIPSEVLIGKLLHPQEMFLPVLLRHNNSLLNERRYYKNRIKTSFQRQIHITSSTVPIIALPSADSPYVP